MKHSKGPCKIITYKFIQTRRKRKSNHLSFDEGKRYNFRRKIKKTTDFSVVFMVIYSWMPTT